MSSVSKVAFADAPFLAVWETTRDCDLNCRFCLARGLPPSSDELTTSEGFALLTELAQMGTPFCMLSGGDPSKREDLALLVQHGTELGIAMVTILAATPRIDEDLLGHLKSAGLVQLALNLDGPRESIHDSFTRTGGAFLRTMRCAADAAEVDLDLQINTMFSGDNVQHFDAMAAFVSMLRATTWEVFLLVPIGAARGAVPMTVQQVDELLTQLAALSGSVDFEIKVSEAPQYCLYFMRETDREAIADLSVTPPHSHRALQASARLDFSSSRTVRLARTKVNAGNGTVFVSSSGDIYPSDFLPLRCGNVRCDSLRGVYQNHPTFRDLRSPDRLKGKCGVCKYREVCGGSRARAYAMTGDFLAEEPLCSYEPAGVS